MHVWMPNRSAFSFVILIDTFPVRLEIGAAQIAQSISRRSWGRGWILNMPCSQSHARWILYGFQTFLLPGLFLGLSKDPISQRWRDERPNQLKQVEQEERHVRDAMYLHMNHKGALISEIGILVFQSKYTNSDEDRKGILLGYKALAGDRKSE
jgi:hypothetical protein